MSDYRPDRWVVVKIVTATERLYKVFAVWSGGYGGGDSWKMNSGITRATLVDDRWEFDGYSGSVYSCHQEAYGTNGYGGNVLQGFIDQMPTQGATMEIMASDTDWATLDYDPLQQWIKSGIDKENAE
jgi:uncharacterized membrane protein